MGGYRAAQIRHSRHAKHVRISKFAGPCAFVCHLQQAVVELLAAHQARGVQLVQQLAGIRQVACSRWGKGGAVSVCFGSSKRGRAAGSAARLQALPSCL